MQDAAATKQGLGGEIWTVAMFKEPNRGGAGGNHA